MHNARTATVLLLVVMATGVAFLQVSAAQSPSPTFDVVSIKRNAARTGSSANERPDGGFTMTNIPVTVLIGRAYSVGVPADWVGVPDWARQERYDVSASSSLPRATAEDRAAMMRAMLADRLKLAVRVEQREQPVYDLVLARIDGQLGPGLKKAAEDIDCVAATAAQRTAADAAIAAGQPPPRTFPDMNAPPAPCSTLMKGNLLTGQIPMFAFASLLRATTGRPVVDKTGLTGIYHVTIEYDRMAVLRGPDTTPTPGRAPSVFTAVQEQLGLKLEPSRALRETLVIDRLERPTEN